MKMCIVILLGIAGILSGMMTYTGQPELQQEFASENEEEENMKREFCTVVETKEEFTLKNTKGEIYHLEKFLQGNFKEGEEVLLIYTQRRELADGSYEADVYAVYEDDSTLQIPAK